MHTSAETPDSRRFDAGDSTLSPLSESSLLNPMHFRHRYSQNGRPGPCLSSKNDAASLQGPGHSTRCALGDGHINST